MPTAKALVEKEKKPFTEWQTLIDSFVTKTEEFKGETARHFLEETPSGYGPLSAVSHSAKLSKTLALWARPAMPLGSHAPQWPARG